MSQHFYEFIVASRKIYKPVPMLVDAQRRRADLFVFQFADAIFSVQDSEEQLNSIDVSMRVHGYVSEAMNAQMVESNTINDK